MSYSPLHKRGLTQTPSFLLSEKEEQLKQAMRQFLRSQTNLCSSGIYVISQWMPQLITNNGHDMIYVYLLNLSTGQIIIRLWELKGSQLLSDSKIYYPDNVTPPGNIYQAEWQQPLVGEALSREKNKSLAAVLERFERKAPKGILLEVHAGECQVKKHDGLRGIKINYSLKIMARRSQAKKLFNIKATVNCPIPFSQIPNRNSKWVSESIEKETILPPDLTVEDKEAMVLFAREELNTLGYLEAMQEWIIDCYYYDYMKKERIVTATFEILLRSQYGHNLILTVTVGKDGEKYKVINVKKVSPKPKEVEAMWKKGIKVDAWQSFHNLKSSVEYPVIDQLIEAGINAMKPNLNFIRLKRIECRCRRQGWGINNGFEYKMDVLIEKKREELFQQWILHGNNPANPEIELVWATKLEEPVFWIDNLGTDHGEGDDIVFPLDESFTMLEPTRFTRTHDRSKSTAVRFMNGSDTVRTKKSDLSFVLQGSTDSRRLPLMVDKTADRRSRSVMKSQDEHNLSNVSSSNRTKLPDINKSFVRLML